VHAPTQDKSNDTMDGLYEELERVLDLIPKDHVEILFGDFSANEGTETILKPAIGSKCVH
jgi:hypothetical protein